MLVGLFSLMLASYARGTIQPYARGTIRLEGLGRGTDLRPGRCHGFLVVLRTRHGGVCKVQGLGFRVRVLGCRNYGLGFRVQGLGMKV